MNSESDIAKMKRKCDKCGGIFKSPDTFCWQYGNGEVSDCYVCKKCTCKNCDRCAKHCFCFSK
jgi:hypothetical protein